MVWLKRLFVAGLAIAAVWFLVLFATRGFPLKLDTSFVQKATLKYHYLDKAIDVAITDCDDIKGLKETLAGPVWRDAGLSCGFDISVSITLTGGGKSVTLCPACDTCSNIRIYGSDRFVAISDEQRQRFEAIVKKYGMIFPCI